MMKNAKFENKKIDNASKPRPMAGVKVRSGVKAGRRFDEFGDAGRPGRPGRLG